MGLGLVVFPSRPLREMLGRLLLLASLASCAHATVYLVTNKNASYPFEDADAAFGGSIPSAGMEAVLRQAIPFDGCSGFDNIVEQGTTVPQFALIMRGNCQFDVKVLNAQLAGYSAAIIYDDEDSTELITMSGRRIWDIYIPAVFVTLNSGRQMLSLLEKFETACILTPAFEDRAWSIMTASFVSLFALCSVLTLFVYLRRARFGDLTARVLERDPMGMSAVEVEALPELQFWEGKKEAAGLETCAICLDDYEDEDTLRLLPCKHGFHALCIDQWLITRSPCCPVCKRNCKSPEDTSVAAGQAGEASPVQIVEHSGDRWFIGTFPERLTIFSFLFPRQGALEAPLLPTAGSSILDSRDIDLGAELAEDGPEVQESELPPSPPV